MDPGDILDILSLQDAMEGIDTVIHSAAIISFLDSEKKICTGQMWKERRMW